MSNPHPVDRSSQHIHVLTERIETGRKGTIALIDRLTREAHGAGLPQPSGGLIELRRRLEDNTFNVLVVGEAKRGKSSFINALIGRPVVPTDVDIATSQVFRIRSAESPAYRLRFEDGSTREIEEEDLPRYGSQVEMERGTGLRLLNHVVKWIEVDVPIRFLPPGVSLLDTPGMGSLYASHTEITQRFVPLADAVIFVLESGQVIGDLDLSFLESILAVTKNVFFIQTKIDQYRPDAWQDIQRRNEEILAGHFGDRLVDPRVWPISSTNLMKGAQTDDEDYLIVSRHRELAAALRNFLFRVSGWSRDAAALALALDYHAKSRHMLGMRLASLTEESEQQRVRMQQAALGNERQFDAEWGPGGPGQQRLEEGIKRIAGVGRQGFRQALKQGGAIARKHEQRIEALTSVSQAALLGESLAAEVTADVMTAWREVCSRVETQTIELFRPFAIEAESVVINAAQAEPVVHGMSALRLESDAFSKYMTARGSGSVAFSTAGIGLGILASLGLIALPLVGIGAASAGLWGLVRGWKVGASSELEQARHDLQQHLNKVLQRSHQHFFDVDPDAGRFSLVDEYFRQFEERAMEHLHTIAERKAAETRNEVKRMTEAVQIDDEHRRGLAAVTRDQIARWDELGRALAARVAETETLQTDLEASSSRVAA